MPALMRVELDRGFRLKRPQPQLCEHVGFFAAVLARTSTHITSLCRLRGFYFPGFCNWVHIEFFLFAATAIRKRLKTLLLS